MGKPVQVEAHGETVWSDTEMDELRKENCLCLRCARLKREKGCLVAKDLCEICREWDLALMVTRCLDWAPRKEKKGKGKKK